MFIRIAVGVTLALLLVYGGTRAWPLLAGPELVIVSPSQDTALPEGHLALSGRAYHTETLWLNGVPLLMDEAGAFSSSLVLPHGSAILSLTATDRFGREITERRTVFVP